MKVIVSYAVHTSKIKLLPLSNLAIFLSLLTTDTQKICAIRLRLLVFKTKAVHSGLYAGLKLVMSKISI